jgi:hypothetical protein
VQQGLSCFFIALRVPVDMLEQVYMLEQALYA